MRVISRVQTNTGYLTQPDPVTSGELRDIVITEDIDDADYFIFDIEKKSYDGYDWWEGTMITPDWYPYGTLIPWGQFNSLFNNYVLPEPMDYANISYSPRVYISKSVKGYPSTVYPYFVNKALGSLSSVEIPITVIELGENLQTLFNVNITKLNEGEKEEDHPAYVRLIDLEY